MIDLSLKARSKRENKPYGLTTLYLLKLLFSYEKYKTN